MDQYPELGPIKLRRREGSEPFRDASRELEFDLSSFWQWSCSDLVSNATRGVLAEYLVARALDAAEGVRDEWAAYDLTAADGTRIEVKSAAYIQSWHQKQLSRITYRVPKTHAWDRETNSQSRESKRQADVYVFALLAHDDQATLDPLDVSQWEFYVLATAQLDNRGRSQHSITLPSLRALAGGPVPFSGLRIAVQAAAELQRRMANKPMQSDGAARRR